MTDTSQIVARLLDFTQPTFDTALLDQVVTSFYTARTNEEVRGAGSSAGEALLLVQSDRYLPDFAAEMVRLLGEVQLPPAAALLGPGRRLEAPGPMRGLSR